MGGSYGYIRTGYFVSLMNLAAAFRFFGRCRCRHFNISQAGTKDYDTAQRVLGNVVVLNIIIGIFFTLLTLLFLDPILYFFGASEQTIGYARDFMQIILAGNIVTHLYMGLNATLRAAGHPKKAMMATVSTVVINVLLAPLFIFVLGWGIRGAATATVLAQFFALFWQLKVFSNPNELLHFHKGIFRLRKKIVLNSLAIGMSPFMMNLASLFNRYLNQSWFKGTWWRLSYRCIRNC